jgi:crotonobetainyl-CoA:carnitine CoA-transferase CaiB-like acyl-CoA transferase
VKEYRHPPRLGEHTKEVLATIGYDDAKQQGLRERKVI